jgi:hypothetical protein
MLGLAAAKTVQPPGACPAGMAAAIYAIGLSAHRKGIVSDGAANTLLVDFDGANPRFSKER